MGNVRVFQLARELNLSSQEVIDRLKRLGSDAKTASSSVDEDTSDKLKRSVKIDQLTAKKKRVYGSDEDETDREREERELREKIAAERDARERAAADAREAAEARRKGLPVPAKKPAPGETPAVLLAPAAPRLAPRVAPAAAVSPSASATAVEDQPAEAEEREEVTAVVEAPPEPEVEAAPEPAVEPAPVVAEKPAPRPAPPVVRGPIRPLAPPPAPVVAAPVEAEAPAEVEPEAPAAPAVPAVPAVGAPPAAPRIAPRLGPVRPIAPPPPPPPPPAPAPSAVASAPVMQPVERVPVPAQGNLARPGGPGGPRPLRPIASPRPIPPPRPVGPHPTSPHATGRGLPGAMAPRGQHPVSPRPGMPGARPGMPGAPGAYPQRPGMGARPGSPMPARPANRRQERRPIQAPVERERPIYSGPPRKITLSEGVTVKELSDRMPDAKSRDIMKSLIQRGIMATVNQTLDPALAIEICREFGYEAAVQSFEEELVSEQQDDSNPEDLVPRAPVVTVMGHVDHGKTSLLDAIRTTTVAAGEAGGITQHIGAYHVDVGPRKVVFLDTPGHEAFTLMRARGAKVTDVVVLVVAADDGVMPQTIEAIDHAKAAGVPIVVAVNKVDKPDAQPDRVRQQLSDRGLQPEEWGGTTVFVNVSAKKKQNLEQLLEMLLLVADLQDLKANPKKAGFGTVLEARLDKGRGPVATVLVQDGTLSVGDTVVAGAVSGRVRALNDDQGKRLKEAGPATPVEVLGLGALPEPGDQLLVVTDQAKAQSIASFRQLKAREKAMAQSSRIRLEDLGRAIAEGQMQELPLVIKADVQGSVEAVTDQLMKIPQQKIRLRVIRSGAGAITESDVLLAAASNGVVIGFNVRPERKAQDAAERDKVEVRLYTVIYDAVEEMRKAMEGLLEPTTREVRLGAAEVRDTFKISKIGTIAGCFVIDGKVNRGNMVRLLRDNVVIHTGKVSSLKRFKEDVTEVKSGFECGIGIANYNDLKPADVIEFFTTEKVKETLA